MDGGPQQFANVELPPVIAVAPDPDWDLGAYAQHAVLTRFARLLEQRQVVWDNSSPDGVHDIRVAARRCRTALQTFSMLWDEAAVRRFSKRLSKFASRFGRARDLDVLIIHLQQKLAGDAGELAPGYTWLLGLYQGLRQGEQPRLEKALRRFEKRELPRLMVEYFSKHPVDLWGLEVPDG